VLKGRSFREVYLATQELKERLDVSSVPVSKLAEFMNSVEAEEILLKQRMSDREQGFILHQINGDLLSDAAIAQVDVESAGFDEVCETAKNVIQFPVAEVIEDYTDEEELFTGYPVI
jgi:hypothetical protein